MPEDSLFCIFSIFMNWTISVVPKYVFWYLHDLSKEFSLTRPWAEVAELMNPEHNSLPTVSWPAETLVSNGLSWWLLYWWFIIDHRQVHWWINSFIATAGKSFITWHWTCFVVSMGTGVSKELPDHKDPRCGEEDDEWHFYLRMQYSFPAAQLRSASVCSTSRFDMQKWKYETEPSIALFG